MHLAYKIISVVFFSFALGSNAFAESEIGTVSVNFAPVTSSGITTGCSLIFITSFLDNIHKQGKPVALNGNISVNSFPDKNVIMLTYKLGLRDFTNKGLDNPYPPYFMFLKSSKHSTAKSKFVPNNSDIQGYKIYAVQIDEEALGVLNDMAQDQKILIGYNLSKDGMDAIVPLDLTVEDTNLVNGEIKRLHSNDTTLQFAKCLGEIADNSSKTN